MFVRYEKKCLILQTPLSLMIFVLHSIRHITAEVGAAVVQAAVAEEVAEGHSEVAPRELEHMSKVS